MLKSFVHILGSPCKIEVTRFGTAREGWRLSPTRIFTTHMHGHDVDVTDSQNFGNFCFDGAESDCQNPHTIQFAAYCSTTGQRTRFTNKQVTIISPRYIPTQFEVPAIAPLLLPVPPLPAPKPVAVAVAVAMVFVKLGVGKFSVMLYISAEELASS